jgi:glutathione S-transferase
MKLYYSSTSPYVRKVNVCAIELGLDEKLERIITNPWEMDKKLLADNPLSKVPTLITDDGMVLYDSPVICEYLDSMVGVHTLFPPEGNERWLALRIQALGDGILDAAVLRFLENKRPANQQSSEWDEIQRNTIARALDYLQSNVSEWGSHVTIGQIAVACALGYLDFRFAEEDWREALPGLKKWYEAFVNRPSMQATLPVISG